jgi:hypothetical protein
VTAHGKKYVTSAENKERGVAAATPRHVILATTSLLAVQRSAAGSTGATPGYIGQLATRAVSLDFVSYPDGNPFGHEKQNQYHYAGEDYVSHLGNDP